MRRRTAVVACTLSVVGLAVFVLAEVLLEPPAAPEPDGPLARYPELLRADPGLCSRLRKAFAEPDSPFGPSPYELPPAARDILSEAGEGAARALLRVLVEDHGRLTGCVQGVPWSEGKERASCAEWLGGRDGKETRDLIGRMLSDADLHEGLRLLAVIALCRPAHVDAVPALAAVARDPEQSPDVRKAIVTRVHRIGVPLEAELGELLSLPYHGLDRLAAAAIAAGGECPAPSLLLRAARHDYECETGILVGDALRRTTAGDAEIVTLVDAIDPWEPFGRKRHEDPARKALAAVFERWLDRHPEMFETAFERDRRAYLESDQLGREMALLTFEDVVASDEADLDLAAAALLLEDTPEEWREHYLEGLHRLAGLVRRDLLGRTDPESVLAVLRRRLLTRRTRHQLTWECEASTRLGVALQQGAANCLGLTLLYLAVAERLDLPLHAVEVPEHVFVRWDDGTTRRNVEVTSYGAEVTDAEYAEGRGVEDVASGVYLVNLPKRRVLSILLSNLAFRSLVTPGRRAPGKFEWALEKADRAARLDAGNAGAYLARAQARMALRPDLRDEILADVDRALALRPRDPVAHLVATELLRRNGRHEEALGRVERALEISPENGRAVRTKVAILLDLGRLEEARSLADGYLEEHANRGVRVLRYQALVRLRDPAWRAELRELVGDSPVGRPGLHLDTVELLLRAEAGAPPDPHSAMVVLKEIAGLARKDRVVTTVNGTVMKTGEAIDADLARYRKLRDAVVDALRE